MHPWASRRRAALAALLLSACGRPAPPSPAPPATVGDQAGLVVATTTGAAAAPVPAPTTAAADAARLPAPVDAPQVAVLEAQALIPGAATALRTGEQVTVDPGSTFRVLLEGTFVEARLSLLDGADAMLPAAGAREAGPRTTVTLQPATPLKPGSAYRLRVDGATTRELKAADGAVRAPVEFPILAAGEPPPEPKSRTRAKKTRQRP